MKILLIGRSEIMYATAEHLIKQSAHNILGIIVAPSRPEYKKHTDDFKTLAGNYSFFFYELRKIDDHLIGFLREKSIDVAVSVNWVSVFNEKFIQLFPYGIINAHFGDLPNYRGNAVTNWALLAGETSVTLTLHKVEANKLDSGDIYLKKTMPISDTTTIQDINEFAQQHTPTMFAEVLDNLSAGLRKPIPESSLKREGFRCYPRLPAYGKIDWHLSAQEIDALVRSLVKPYSGAYTYYRTKTGHLEKLYVWKTRIIEKITPDRGVPGHVIHNNKNSQESWIYTGKGILALQRVSHGSKGDIFSPGCVWNSIRTKLGLDLEEELFCLLTKELS